MQNLFQELGLSLFSVCLQTSIGMIAFLFIFERFYKLKSKTLVFAALGIAIIGVLSSFVHLGNPSRAFLTMSNLSTSWLSREIFVTSLYTTILAIYFFLRFIKNYSDTKFDALGLLVVGIGIADLYVMSKAYISTSVPFWDSLNTYFEYYLSAVMLGAIFFYALIYKQLGEFKFYNFSMIILLSVSLLAISYIFHGLELSQGSDAAKQSAQILSSYSWLMVLIWVFGGMSMCLFMLQGMGVVRGANIPNGINLPIVSAGLLFIAALIAKLIFYIAMVTTSVGIQ